jgi:hypothetical protein
MTTVIALSDHREPVAIQIFLRDRLESLSYLLGAENGEQFPQRWTIDQVMQREILIIVGAFDLEQQRQ